MFIWEEPDWPELTWDSETLAPVLAQTRHAQGRLLGRMEALGFDLQGEAELRTLTSDVLMSSEIEGEKLDREQVRSSVARRLGLEAGGLVPSERDVEGVVEMMLDATQEFDQPLSEERLFAWHASLFPTGRSGMRKLRVGAWRDDEAGPMQVVSGPVGRERVHYVAPPARQLADEMKAFLVWFNAETPVDPVLKSGLAHFWFVTVHPFDDGNGRIARAISDMMLARSENSVRRFYSMSTQIRAERDAYYDRLEASQRDGIDVTAWLAWFLDCHSRAVDGAQRMLGKVLSKARFWEQVSGQALNERQIKVLNRLLDGFEGKLTSSKWAKLAKCSQDTAQRDIVDLMQRGVLSRSAAGGRSTSYDLDIGQS